MKKYFFILLSLIILLNFNCKKKETEVSNTDENEAVETKSVDNRPQHDMKKITFDNDTKLSDDWIFLGDDKATVMLKKSDDNICL